MSRYFVFFLALILVFSQVIFAQDEEFSFINFNSDKNVGHPPLLVNFHEHCKILDNVPEGIEFYWDSMYNGRTPVDRGIEGPNVWFQYIKSGQYNVFKGGRNFQIEHAKQNFIEIYEPNGYAPLVFVSGSVAHEKYPWENLVDADTYCWDGVVLTSRESAAVNPFAILEFKDGKTKNVNKFRVRTDAGVDRADLWSHAIAVSVAADAENPVYEHVLAGTLSSGDWTEFEISPAVAAASIKFEITDPRVGELMVTEFEAYEDIPIPSPELSTLSVSSPHFADEEDAAKIILTLKDENGNPITTFDDSDITFYLNYQDANFGPLNLINADQGIYSTQLTSKIPGTYQVIAVSHGAIIYNDIIGDNITPAYVEFYGFAGQVGELQFIEGSPTSKAQGWDNLIDGDLEGWDGTVTASGTPAYAIYEFPRNIRMPINKIYLKTDNGQDDNKYHYRQYNKIEILYSNDFENWNNLLTITNRLEDYKYFWVPRVFAKYIKLVVTANDQRRDNWKQLVEFQVQFDSHEGFGYANEQETVKQVSNYNLASAFPNPFNPSTTIQFEIPKEEHVKLYMFNARGQLVDVLVDGYLGAGMHRVSWDASQQSSGIYFYKMIAGEYSKTHRILYLK